MGVVRIAILAAALAVVLAVPAAAEVRSFERTVPAGGATLRVPGGFDLAGVRGAGAHAELRARRVRGGWSRWADAHDGEPIWTGRADALQVRGARGARVRLVAVDDPPAAPVAVAAAGRPAIVPRAAWDPHGECRPRVRPIYGRVDFAVVHHTESLSFYTPQQSPAIVLGICRFHRDGNRWNDIGYNLLIDRWGTVFEGREGGVEQPVVGAQAGGWNTVSTGVALIGSYSVAAPPPAAQQALARVLAWKLSLAGVPAQGSVLERSYGGDVNRWRAGALVRFQRIAGHRDADLTACPGNAVMALLPRLRETVARLQPRPRDLLTLSPVGDEPLRHAEPAALTGRLVRAGGRRPAGAEVRVEQRVGGAWTEVARTRTGADGIWSAKPRLAVNGPLRAVAAASGIVSQVVEATVRAGVRLSVAPARLPAGATLRVTGTTTPAKARALVVVERRVGDEDDADWRRVAVRAVDTVAGAFDVAVPLARAGLYRVFAVTRADADNAAGRSAARVVRVGRAR